MSSDGAVQDDHWNDSVCRLCLSKDGNESVFHRGVHTEVDLAERIFQCVSIRISKENPLPVFVCHECIHFVNEWHKFREKCHKMQTVLLSRLKDLLSNHVRPKVTSNGLPEKPKEPPAALSDRRQSDDPPASQPPISDDGGGDSEASSTTAPPVPLRDEPMDAQEETYETPMPSQVDTTDDTRPPPSVNGGGESDSVLKRALEQNREEPSREIDDDEDDDEDEIECVSSEPMGMPVDSSEVLSSGQATPDQVRSHPVIKPKSWSSSKIRIESTVTLPAPDFSDSSMQDDGNQESREEVSRMSQPGSSGFNQSRTMDIDGLISLANVKAEPEDDYSDSFEAQSPVSDGGGSLPRVKQEFDGMDADMDFNSVEMELDMGNLSARDLADICRLRGDDSVSIKGIKCLVCRHRFSSLHSLLRHTSSQTHLIAKDFTAKMKSGLLTPAAIALHNKRMLAFKNKANRKRVPGQPFVKSRIVCRTCNRAFISKRELLRHEEYYKHGSFHPMVRARNPPLLPAVTRPGQLNMIQIQRPGMQGQGMQGQAMQQRQFTFHQQPVRIQPQQSSQASILNAQFRINRPQVTIQPAGSPSVEQREYICPIPNCNYICSEGSVLLTHMTSHGINQKAQQLPSGTTIQRKILPQQPQNNPYALQYRPPPQNRARPLKVGGPPPTRDFYCPFHHVYFNSARGYLNHARVCRRCPPLASSRKNPHAGLQSGAQIAQQLVQSHLKLEPDQSSETTEQTESRNQAQGQQQSQSQSSKDESPRNCKICNLRFASHQIFLNHMQAYHKNAAESAGLDSSQPKLQSSSSQPQRKWICNVCNKEFTFSYALKHHMKVHQTPSVPTCKVCKQTFNTIKTCLSHLKTHFLPHGSKLFFCTSCLKSYASRSELARHRYEGLCSMDENSLKVTSYRCNSCEQSFDSLEGLNQHKLDDHGGSTAEPEGGLEKDDGEEDDEDEDPEAMEGEDLGDEGAQEGDEEDQSGGDDSSANASPVKVNEPITQIVTPTYCKPCDKSFATYQNLKRHCKTSHSWSEVKIKEMIASYMSVDVKNEPADDGGDQNQTPGQSSYSCEFCNATFTLRRILTLHVNNFCHNSPSRPRCDRCGEPIMKNKPCENCIQLDEQMQGDPDQDMNQDEYVDDQQPSFMYKCPIGNMSFMDESAMVQHYSYCTGNCPALFKCAKCNAEFKYKKSFEAHHCGYSRKPTRYHCSDCNRTFSRKNYLVNHKPKCPGYPQTPEEIHIQQQQQRAAAQRASGSFPRHFMAPAPTQSLKKTRQSGPVDEDEESSAAAAAGFSEGASADLVSHACPDCPKVFFCQKALIGHEYVHKGTPEDPMFCRFCGKQNMLLEQMYTHTYKCLKSLFRTEEILSCDQCNLAMSRYEIGKELAAKVNRHVLSCYPIPFFPGEEKEGGEKLLCYLCCHAFSSAESLASHKITHKSHLKSRYRRSSPFVKPARKRARTHALPPSAAASSSANVSGTSTPSSKADFDAGDMEEECVSENETTSIASSSDVTSSTDLACGICGRRFLNAEKLRNHEKVHGIVRENVYDEEEDDEDMVDVDEGDDVEDGEEDNEGRGEDDNEGHGEEDNEGHGEEDNEGHREGDEDNEGQADAEEENDGQAEAENEDDEGDAGQNEDDEGDAGQNEGEEGEDDDDEGEPEADASDDAPNDEATASVAAEEQPENDAEPPSNDNPEN